jgi:hypothetical protein
MYNVLEHFMGETPVAHLEWEIEDITGAQGVTFSTNNNELIHIQLDQSYVETASSISLARTMLHEALHAEVMKKMISVGAYPEPSENLGDHFPTYWKYYVAYAYSWDPNKDIPRFMHNHMADKYRSRIIEGLREFDLANGKTHDQWEYEALAWAGLSGTLGWRNFKHDNPILASKYENYYTAQANRGNSCSNYVHEKPEKL